MLLQVQGKAKIKITNREDKYYKCWTVRVVNDQISSYLASCYALFKLHLS